jgi:hypothetical protein
MSYQQAAMHSLSHGLCCKEGIGLDRYIVIIDSEVSSGVDEALELDRWALFVSCHNGYDCGEITASAERYGCMSTSDQCQVSLWTIILTCRQQQLPCPYQC